MDPYCEASSRVSVKNSSDIRAFQSEPRQKFMLSVTIISYVVLTVCVVVFGYYKHVGLKRLAIRSRIMIFLNLIPILLYLNSNVLFGVVGAINYPWLVRTGFEKVGQD